MDAYYSWTKIEKLKDADNLWEKTCDFPIQVTITYREDFLYIPYADVTLIEGDRTDVMGQKKLVVKSKDSDIHQEIVTKWMNSRTELSVVLTSTRWRPRQKCYQGFFVYEFSGYSNSLLPPGVLETATLELIRPHLVELPPDQISSRQSSKD